jgi:3-dehydroquinate synthase
MVVADLETLGTLPGRELRAAYAEIVKMALVGDAALFAHLEQHGPQPLDEMVARCAEVKLGFVARDPEDHGERQLLNLGHTFAHALETASMGRLIHGEAVAVGLAVAVELSCRLGLCPPDLAGRVVTLLERLGLPLAFGDVTPESILPAMAVDKKRRAGALRLVLVRDVGQGCLVPVSEIPPAALRAALEARRG